MTKKTLTKLSLSAFATLIAAVGANAQSSSCPLRLDMTRTDGGTVVKNAAATATNLSTKRRYSAVATKGVPVFAKLPEGRYVIRVSKAGFKKYESQLGLICGDGTSSFEVYLNPLPGNYRQPPVAARPDVKSQNYTPRVDNSESVGTKCEVKEVPAGETKVERTPKIVSGGVVNGKATNLVSPAYPAAARAVNARGAVNVQVTIDEQGRVISASAVSGHPLLRAAAVEAARQSTFSPTMLSGVLVKVTGVVVYNFVP